MDEHDKTRILDWVRNIWNHISNSYEKDQDLVRIAHELETYVQRPRLHKVQISLKSIEQAERPTQELDPQYAWRDPPVCLQEDEKEEDVKVTHKHPMKPRLDLSMEEDSTVCHQIYSQYLSECIVYRQELAKHTAEVALVAKRKEQRMARQQAILAEFDKQTKAYKERVLRRNSAPESYFELEHAWSLYDLKQTLHKPGFNIHRFVRDLNAQSSDYDRFAIQWAMWGEYILAIQTPVELNGKQYLWKMLTRGTRSIAYEYSEEQRQLLYEQVYDTVDDITPTTRLIVVLAEPTPMLVLNFIGRETFIHLQCVS